MKIDWDELQKGISSEAEKQAALPSWVKDLPGKIWTGVKNLVGKNPGKIGAGVATGAGGAYIAPKITSAINTGLSNAGDMLNYLPLLNSLGGGGAQKPSAAPRPAGNMILPSNGNVSSLLAPRMQYNPGQPMVVQASLDSKFAGVMDDITDVAKKRMVNHVVNEITQTNPLGMSMQANKPVEDRKEKEIELTSKYPEIAEILKNEQNKAYLERLLKE